MALIIIRIVFPILLATFAFRLSYVAIGMAENSTGYFWAIVLTTCLLVITNILFLAVAFVLKANFT